MRWLSFIEYQSDLLLITKCNFGDGGFTRVLRLDGEDLRVLWSVHISAFNPSRGLVEESSVYLSAIGFVGKLDLENGNLLWQHDNLYERATGCFNSFNSPELIGSMVVFTESSHRRHSEDERRQIRVDRKTGEVIPR
jgi:hypothetical protein